MDLPANTEDYRYPWQLEINWFEWWEWAHSGSCQAESERQLSR
jgi:hypothetical protein